MNKTALSILTLSLVVGIGVIFLDTPKGSTETESIKPVQNVEIRDGVQYITIDARGGYSPRVSHAQGSIPTKLIVRTDGTYDCSAALVIHSIGYRKILSQAGEETIDIGTPKGGASLQGTCSMGMYSFTINFS